MEKEPEETVVVLQPANDTVKNEPVTAEATSIPAMTKSAKNIKYKVPEDKVNPVPTYNGNDVLYGRGERQNQGNLQYRSMIKSHRESYLKARKLEKEGIAVQIVNHIRGLDPPGRFLEQVNQAWYEVGDEKAIEKVKQALREKKTQKKKMHQFGESPKQDASTVDPAIAAAVDAIQKAQADGDSRKTIEHFQTRNRSKGGRKRKDPPGRLPTLEDVCEKHREEFKDDPAKLDLILQALAMDQQQKASDPEVETEVVVGATEEV